jgi:hypothetical protein
MFSHKIDKLQGIIFTRVSGTPSTVSMIDHIQNVLNNPGFDPEHNSIVVLEKNTHIAGIPKQKIETIRSVLDGYAQQRKGRNCAVVTPNQRLKAFLKLNLELIGPIKFNFRIFQSENDALNWLKGK